MIITDTEILTHYLYPSNIFVNRERHVVSTILGSCVSICFFNEKIKMGGINHYMLPFWNNNGLATPRFGNIANQRLLDNLKQIGNAEMHLVAKVFGGAHQINTSSNIGARNIEVAMDFLEEVKIKVVAKSVGGSVGRKIVFDTGTGSVMMKYVKKEFN